MRALFVFFLLSLATARHPPMVFFGGKTKTAGFIYGVNSSSERSTFDIPSYFAAPTEVNYIVCLEPGLSIIGTNNKLLSATTVQEGGDNLSYNHQKQHGGGGPVSPLVSLDGAIEALVEHRSESSHKPNFLLGGMFKGGLAHWDGEKVVGAGVDPLEPACVYALDMADPTVRKSWDVYVGGCFSTAGAMTVNGIAKYTVSLKDNMFHSASWEPLGSGVTGTNDGEDKDAVPAIFAISSSRDVAFVGGFFAFAGGIRANSIAAWIPFSKQWEPVGEGVVGVVRALTAAPDGSGVYVGGRYCAKDAPSVCNIAWWDSVHRWKSFGGGIRGEVMALLMTSDRLWIGGNFNVPETGQTNLAVWLGREWGRENFDWNRGIVETIGVCPCEEGMVFDDNYGGCAEIHSHGNPGITLIFWSGIGVAAGVAVLVVTCVLKRRRTYSDPVGSYSAVPGADNDEGVDASMRGLGASQGGGGGGGDGSNSSSSLSSKLPNGGGGTGFKLYGAGGLFGSSTSSAPKKTVKVIDIDAEYQLDDYNDEDL